MKKIKNLIIMLIIIIVIILLLIVILKVNKINQEKQIELEGDPGEEVEVTNEIEYVSNRGKFNTVKQCVQKYYDAMNNQSSNFYSEDEEGNDIKIVSDEEINQLRLDLLSEEYIAENDINLNNINQYIKTVEEKVIVVALQMRQIFNMPTEKYVVYGMIINLDYEVLDDFYIYVNLDTEESTFSIEPLTDSYHNIEEVQLENDNISIESNDNNQYNEVIFDYEDTVKEYFSTYKKIILSAPQIIYNYLDEEYRESRFGDLGEFRKYVEKNKEEILGAQLQKYLVNNYNDYNEYVCMDQYQNVYTFHEINPMDFTLTLDTYTITSDKFKTEYKKADNQKKITMNIDKWIQMLNNRDYTAAYNVLDETYRNNTFGNEEQFEATMREKLPLHYKAEYSNFSEENETYLQDITLTDITEENEDSVQISVIMQLKEDLDFVMSFSIQEQE